jgi:hypothetical protein
MDVFRHHRHEGAQLYILFLDERSCEGEKYICTHREMMKAVVQTEI